jgi:acetate kinase
VSISSENTPWISASALGGVKSIEITLSEEEFVPESSYTVRLYFAELEDNNQGEREFDIAIQGEKVAHGFDILKEAGQPDKEVIKSFEGIKAGKTLKIDLIPVKGNTLISGIELTQEKLAEK